MKEFKFTNLFLPPIKSNLLMFKNNISHNYAYFYSKFFFFQMASSYTNSVVLNKNTLSLKFIFNNSKKLPSLLKKNLLKKKTLILKKLYWLFTSWNYYFFKKLKFKGKVYKMIRNINKKLKLSFGRCHINIAVMRNLFLKKKKKRKLKFLVFSTNYINVLNTVVDIRNIRPINIFTQRGLRLSRQVIYKKVGKKSSYMNKS
jgi:hypothetical protein